MNVCILLGRLKDDPVIRRHNSGNEIATLVIEEIVVQRDRESGAPVERTVHHQVRIYNQSFVNVAKAEGARGRHVEVHGALSYAEDGKAFVSVPPHGGRVAFKSFEVREIPHEPPPVVADHDAARDLAEAVPEPEAPTLPDLGAAPEATSSPSESAPEPSQAVQDSTSLLEGVDREAPTELPKGQSADRTTPTPRPPLVGGGRPSPVGIRPAPAQPSAAPGQARPPVQPRAPTVATNPPPSRPSVGGGAARPGAPSSGGAIAGVAQPRAQVPPRIGGPVTRPTLAVRPAPPQPVGAVGGNGPGRLGGGIGRVSVAPPAARQANDRTWRSTAIDDQDMDDPPF